VLELGIGVCGLEVVGVSSTMKSTMSLLMTSPTRASAEGLEARWRMVAARSGP
jgi:hypothetical protein